MEASTRDLWQLRLQVKKHKKHNRQNPAFSNVRNFSTHDAIISAINFNLLKRSKWYRIYKLILPVRKRIVSWFSGIDIQEHPYFGILYVPHQNRKTFLHITHSELTLILKKFWLLHWQWIIGTIIALGVLVIMILNYYAEKIP